MFIYKYGGLVADVRSYMVVRLQMSHMVVWLQMFIYGCICVHVVNWLLKICGLWDKRQTF